ncbi:MAG: hypothetical protein FMNOHCHN_01304 [Ignavibacteriaceae bacterium]|nr:hypothetical protein [Ignavibacteriaceae bacterium]MCK6615571.1 GIY-YIG nuclease family protein [Ignavibacteriaceae bacterium]
MYHAYILKSLINGKHYFGSCASTQERLKQHNAGKVRSSKANRPYEMIYFESFETRSEAYRREMFFKTLEGRNWLRKQNIL